MSYKDMTFCQDWCNNKECNRNYQHIINAVENKEIDQNTQVSFFVAPPLDCTIRIPKNNP